jgi:broad specificity phosphatase PhoE
MPHFLAALVFALALATPAGAADDAEAAWAALDLGAIALIRHPETSGGSGDPPGFRLEDCTTQRLLNARGRQQAVALGEAWRRRGISVRRMLSSQWCRCIETGILMDISPVQPFAPLNNVSGRPEAAQAQAAALKRLVAEWKGPGALVLISHNSTIQAFAGLGLAESEIVVVEPQPDSERGLRVVGRIPAPR